MTFLAHPGPALLDVKVNRDELLMPPKVEISKALGMALYSAKATLAGCGGDVAKLIENFVE